MFSIRAFLKLFAIAHIWLATAHAATQFIADGRYNIFGAGHTTSPAPAGGGGGIQPVWFRLTPGAGKILTFSGLAGGTTYAPGSPSVGPDGAAGTTNINSTGGIAGIVADRYMFLAGVFTDESEPADPAPARLDFRGNTSFASVAPGLRQVFFIGDGRTGTGTGNTQQFTVPATATRLYLGFADAFSFLGNVGYYGDNGGQLTGSFDITGTPACDYLVTPLTVAAPAGGGSGVIQVLTGQTCTWTAASNASWITIAAGASGTGNGAVSYTTAANNTGSTRTGTLRVAGSTVTFTQASGAPCGYSISSTAASFAATAGAGSVQVTTSAAGCAWTASSGAGFVTITSGSSGAGNGTVNYSVAANTATTSRSGTLTIAGRSHTVTQAGVTSSGPVISQGGVVNAASYIPASLPAGAIARGAFFSIFGRFGPPSPVRAESYPIATTLAGVSIRVSLGATAVSAFPVFVSGSQINAILPSNAPLGDAQLTVTYQGAASPAMPMKIVENNFGVFSTAAGRGPGIIQNFVSATELPLNTRRTSARPSQVVILWGTGLGGITTPDNQAPPAQDLRSRYNVRIFTGGREVRNILYAGRTPCCAGVDQIVFEVNSDSPVGCAVPVQVQSVASYSNTVTMSIDAQGAGCNDPGGVSNVLSGGGKVGAIALFRADVAAALGGMNLNLTVDLGLALFQELRAGGDTGYHPLLSLPPVGTCQDYTGDIDLSGLLGGGGSVPRSGYGGRYLDAGRELTIIGPGGARRTIGRLDASKLETPYAALLGGSIPGFATETQPLFLEPGEYRISAPGGADVRSFEVRDELAVPATWTNRSQTSILDRAAGLRFNWTGGNAVTQSLLIAGFATNTRTKGSGGFTCVVSLNDGAFTVPPPTLANIPRTEGSPESDAFGVLVFATVPKAQLLKPFIADGLDYGFVIPGTASVKTVSVR